MTEEQLCEIKKRIEECKSLCSEDHKLNSAIQDREELYDAVICLTEELENMKKQYRIFTSIC